MKLILRKTSVDVLTIYFFFTATIIMGEQNSPIISLKRN